MSRFTSRSTFGLLTTSLVLCLLIVAVGEDGRSSRPAADDTQSHDALTAERIRLSQTAEASIRQKFAKRISVNVDERPLKQVVEDLARDSDIPLVIDHVTLKDEGVSLDQTVTLHVTEITLGSALRLLLRPYQLQTIIRDELLTITTAVKAEESLESRVYDVGSLLVEGDFTELLDSVTSCVAPDSWDEVGGANSIREFDRTHSLIVRATQDVHESIARLLADLESVIHPGKQGQKPNPVREREAGIRKRLLEVCTVESEGQPLDRIITELAATHQIPVWIDQETLKDEGISFEQQVTTQLKDMRIESALSHLFRPLELTWIVEDEVLKVTTVVRAAELLQTRVYDVRDLARRIEPTWPPRAEGDSIGCGIGGTGASGSSGGRASDILPTQILRQGFGGMPPPGGDWCVPGPVRWETGGYDLTELTEAIKSTTLPDSWDEVGGPGSIRGYRQTLVVRQTEDVHRQIQTLFENLRNILRSDAEQNAGRKDDPAVLKRIVYEFAGKYDYPAEELAKLIPKAIAPESWKDAGGSGMLQVQPNSLVITQTQAIHKEIVKLLFEVVLHTHVAGEH